MQDSEKCELDPNFAVICSFLERFGKHLGPRFADLSIEDLKAFLLAPEVDAQNIFVSLHQKLNYGIGQRCHTRIEEWYKSVIRFCKDFPDGDDVLIREKGYANIPITAKLRILKNLCEDQFEYNDRFNRSVNEELAEGTNIRHEAIGKDKLGRSYWFMQDEDGGLRLFRGWRNNLTKVETWNVVCSKVDELEGLIDTLEENENLKQEDPDAPKPDCMSPVKNISPKDLLSTATEDAANAMYFSSIMSSPRFFKPPKARTKTEILREERKYNLPHCDVEITRLSRQQLRKYDIQQNSPSKTPKKNIKEIENESLESVKSKDNEKHKNETKTGEPGSKSSSDKERSCEVEMDRFDSGNKVTVNIPEVKTSKEKRKSAVDLENDSSKVETVSNNTFNSEDTKGLSKVENSEETSSRTSSDGKDTFFGSCKENRKAKPSVEMKTCDANSPTRILRKKLAGKEHSDVKHRDKIKLGEVQPVGSSDSRRNKDSEEEKGLGKANSRYKVDSEEVKLVDSSDSKLKMNSKLPNPVKDEIHNIENETNEMVSAKEEKRSVTVINDKGDACSQQEIVASDTDQKKTDVPNQKDSSIKHITDPDDEKNVFDNAIQDLIQLERKSVNELKCGRAENGKNNKVILKEATNKNDITSDKGKPRKDKKHRSKQAGEETGETDTDSIDNDKQVIDNALKDLMQLEEMVSKSSPASTCISPRSSNDLNVSKIEENRTLKNFSSKEDDNVSGENTSRSADKVNKFEKLSKSKKLPLKNDAISIDKSDVSGNESLATEADVHKSESETSGKVDSETRKNMNEKESVPYDKKTNDVCSERKSKEIEQAKENIKSSDHIVVNSSVKGTSDCNKNSDHKDSVEDKTTDAKKVIDTSEDGFHCGKGQATSDEKRGIHKKDQLELSTKSKETGHKKELPVNEFLAKIMGMIGGDETVSDEKSGTAEQTGTVKTENVEVNNKKLTQFNSQSTQINTAIKGENTQESEKIEKKPLKMMVGDELIQIEVASDNSDEESDTGVVNGNLKKGNVGKFEKKETISEEVKKKVSEYLKSSKESNATKVKNEIEQPKAHKDMKADKEMMKTLYALNSSAIKVSGPKFVLVSPGSNSQLPVTKPSVLGSSTPVLSMIDNRMKGTSVSDLLHSLIVPLVTSAGSPAPLSMCTSLPASGAQFQTLNTMLSNPVVSAGSGTYPIISNNPGFRMVLQNNTSIGQMTLPYIHTAAPRIIYAPKQPPTVITFQKSGILGSSHVVPGTSMQNSLTRKQTSTVASVAMQSLLNKNMLKHSGQTQSVVKMKAPNSGNLPTVVPQFVEKTKEPNVSVQNVTIVLGKDGIHYNKATGKPYLYPTDKKYIVAGPRGKFYDKETGYEVNVPQSENLKHIPGTVYLASGVSFSNEAVRNMMAKKLKLKENRTSSSKDKSSKKGKKHKHLNDEITTSDEEFEKLLESDEGKSDVEISDDSNYDYEKISQRVRAAKGKKLPTRQASLEAADSEDNAEKEESEDETVPVVLGRNAKRAAVRKCTNYAEPSRFLIEEIISEEEIDVNDSEPCKVCSKNEDPSTILLCDKCDSSYHMSCLSPPLSLVPLEDWFCPPCEHNMLIESLKDKLREVRKIQRKSTKEAIDKISVKSFSIDSENIVEVERRSCRTKKDVSYNEANYDKMIQKAVKQMNKPSKNTRSSGSSDSDTDTDTKQTSKHERDQPRKSEKGKAGKRRREGSRKSKRQKSGHSKAKKRKLTSLEDDDSAGSGSEYVQTESSDDSDTDGQEPEQEDMEMGGIYFTSSGRKTKNVSYTVI